MSFHVSCMSFNVCYSTLCEMNVYIIQPCIKAYLCHKLVLKEAGYRGGCMYNFISQLFIRWVPYRNINHWHKYPSLKPKDLAAWKETKKKRKEITHFTIKGDNYWVTWSNCKCVLNPGTPFMVFSVMYTICKGHELTRGFKVSRLLIVTMIPFVNISNFFK